MNSKQDCLSCAYDAEPYETSPEDIPCADCRQVVFTNWKEKVSPTWKIYVEQKVKEKMQNLYDAFEKVPADCQQAMFIRKEPVVPKSCKRCGLGPCPHGVSIRGMNL